MKKKHAFIADSESAMETDRFWTDSQRREVLLRVVSLICILIMIISFNVIHQNC